MSESYTESASSRQSSACSDPQQQPQQQPDMAGRPGPVRQSAPQDVVNEFWKKFTTTKPGKATTLIPQNIYAEAAAKNSPEPEHTTLSSYSEAAAICCTKVKKIADECRAINRKYRDPHFDLESDLKFHRRNCLESLSNVRADKSGGESEPKDSFNPRSVKRVPDIFDEPKFFIDGPSTNDVRQGRNGDCWLLAGLCTLSNKPGLIERICVAKDEQVGVYGFVFHRDGEWFSEIIDDNLYLTRADYDEGYIERVLWDDHERVDSEETYRRIYQSNSGALYFAQCADPNETWLPLLEKCYAKAHGDYSAIEGGFTGEGIEDLTGGVTTQLYASDILDRDAFWKNELLQVNKEFLFGCSAGVWGGGRGDRKGIVERHAYSVVKAVEARGKRLILLKNPWGRGEWKGPWSDGSKEWTAEWMQELNHKFGDDGAFWISYQDLLRKYQAFDRTRLFGDDWRVASIWTSLQVPWKQDYHDTYFSFTLSTPGDVVIVLSQLDDRYFRGLEGQYRFQLAFRVHKAGHEDYLIRSPSSYHMSRSVNVELKLEAGEYTVMVKIDARRQDRILPVEQVIRDNAKTRREKLLRIGLAYDLAHSKGRYIETDEEKRAREAHEKRFEKREKEKLRQDLMKEREETRYHRMKDRTREKERLARQKAKIEAKKAARKEAKAQKQSSSNGKTAAGAKTPQVTIREPSIPKVKNQVQMKDAAGENADSTNETGNTPATPESTASPAEKDPGDSVTEPKETPDTSASHEETSDSSIKPTLGSDIGLCEEPEQLAESENDEEREEDEESEPETISELSDVSEVSEISDRELDMEYENRRARPLSRMPGGMQGGAAPGMAFPPPPPDEFERDPWNAVAVVGLRIYHKIPEEDEDKEVVKLKVVRPNPYSDDECEQEEEDGDDKAKEKGPKKKMTRGKSKALDVDDSAKDATLEGTENERKMSIDPTQAKKKTTGGGQSSDQGAEGKDVTDAGNTVDEKGGAE